MLIVMLYSELIVGGWYQGFISLPLLAICLKSTPSPKRTDKEKYSVGLIAAVPRV
jgi:hypothetical protein